MGIEMKAVTLEEIGGGVVPELFGHALGQVLDNIDDPNTDAAKPRKITVEVKFLPAADRESASVIVAVKSTLVGVKPAATSIFLSREHGVLTAYARNPRQQELPLDNVVAMTQGGEA